MKCVSNYILFQLSASLLKIKKKTCLEPYCKADALRLYPEFDEDFAKFLHCIINLMVLPS